jgi:hypothetical protein
VGFSRTSGLEGPLEAGLGMCFLEALRIVAEVVDGAERRGRQIAPPWGRRNRGIDVGGIVLWVWLILINSNLSVCRFRYGGRENN